MNETAPGGPSATTADVAGKIRRATWEIRDHYSDARHPIPATNEGARGRGTIADPMPAHVLDARRNAHADLLHYARAIQFLAVGADGQTISTRVDGDNPFQLAAFIDRWAEVFTTQDEVEARGCARDLARHGRILADVSAGPKQVRIPLGLCPEHGTSDMGERVPCTGGLRAVFQLDRGGRVCQGIVCTEDTQHAWSAEEWMGLGLRLIERKGAS